MCEVRVVEVSLFAAVTVHHREPSAYGKLALRIARMVQDQAVSRPCSVDQAPPTVTNDHHYQCS